MPAYDGRYENEIRPFVDAMRYKLAVNMKKGRWEDVSLKDALSYLKGEVQELEEAIERGNTMEITMEGADIGNFAMMVVNIAIKQALAGKGSDSFEPLTRGETLELPETLGKYVDKHERLWQDIRSTFQSLLYSGGLARLDCRDRLQSLYQRMMELDNV